MCIGKKTLGRHNSMCERKLILKQQWNIELIFYSTAALVMNQSFQFFVSYSNILY